MNVEIQRNFLTGGYDVWFFERNPARVMRLGDGLERTWEEVAPGQLHDPTLRLPADALEAFLAAAEKVIPASHATERHLNDATKVRDRLLALVEEGWRQ